MGKRGAQVGHARCVSSSANSDTHPSHLCGLLSLGASSFPPSKQFYANVHQVLLAASGQAVGLEIHQYQLARVVKGWA